MQLELPSTSFSSHLYLPDKEFISSVDELLDVREETTRLKDSLTALNRDVQRSGKDLLSKVIYIKLFVKK